MGIRALCPMCSIKASSVSPPVTKMVASSPNRSSCSKMPPRVMEI